MTRVDIDAEAGETLDQLGGDRSQLVLVLVDVLAVDHQQRLLAGEGIGTEGVAGLEPGRRGFQAAVESRDRTVGIAGLLGADRSQAGAQFGRFLGRYRRQGGT
ncbi:hypothetical protein D3C72_1881960 [compost metagenome]